MAQSKWLQSAAFATIPLVFVLGNSMLVPILPELSERMKLSELQSSMVITLFSVSAAMFIPLIGYLSDRMKRKIIIVTALAVYGAAGILAGMGAVWHSYPVLIAARIVQGIAAAGTSPIAMALVGDMYTDGDESEVLGLIEASNGTGKVISPILGSLLGLWVWYAPFFAFPFFCAAALAAVIFLIKEKDHTDKAMPLKTYLAHMKKIFGKHGKWLITAYCAGALGLFILFGMLVYLSDLAEKPPYSITGVAKGGLLAIPLLGLVVTAYTTGRIIKKKSYRMRIFMITGISGIVLSLTAAAIWHGSFIALICFITASSVGTGLLLPCLNTLITGAVDRSHRGMVTSLYNSLRFLGVAAGPPLFSWITGRYEPWLFASLAALSAVSLFTVIRFVHPPKVQKNA